MVFDGSGLWVCAKRLEKNRFAWPVTHPGQSRITLRPGELALLLNGIDLTQAKARPWFRGLSATSNSQDNSGS
jgi:transposase